ncbi:hypothetical protein Tco_0861451, partial [Tanacetum coccineum]
GPNSKVEEEVALEEQQQQAVQVMDITIDKPLGLGYGAAKRHALESTKEKTPKRRDAARASGVEKPCYHFKAVEET